LPARSHIENLGKQTRDQSGKYPVNDNEAENFDQPSFRGDAKASNPESKDSPMRNCASEVHA